MSHSRTMRVFEAGVVGVIVANAGLLVVPLLDHDHLLDEWLDRIEIACLLVFWVDFFVRLKQMGWRRFIRSPWCWFDLSVMVLGSLPFLGHGLSMLRATRLARLAQMGRVARLAHLARHVTHLRLLMRLSRLVMHLHWKVRLLRWRMIVGPNGPRMVIQL